MDGMDGRTTSHFATQPAAAAAAGTATALPNIEGLKIWFATYGCQMNFLDSELALGALGDNGCKKATSEEDADVILFNTCSVRQQAEDRVASNVGRLKARCKREPGLVVGLIGCMAQRDGQGLLDRFPHLKLVAGTREFQRLPELLSQLRGNPTQRVLAVGTDQPVVFNRRPSLRPEWWRAQVTVMRGCDHHCTFCIVPTVRGPEQDVPAETIIEECKMLVDDGVKEITLLGQNVDSWGRRLPDRRKAELGELLHDLDRELHPRGLERLYFITSHPSDFRQPLIDAMRDCPTVCEYLHLPVQSGSTPLLRAMRRGYTREQYLELMQRCREAVPDICIATDWIVGFPGETDDDFSQSLSLLEEVGFTQSFVFRYSVRPGTRAAERLEDDVPDDVKRERNQLMLAAQERSSARLNAARHGTMVEAMCEGASKRDAARMAGRTRGHQIVVWPGTAREFPEGELVKLRVVDSTPLVLVGEPVGE
ncbi:MAG: tRNA (N6-isopentenyl adenosine(37)-C2)-methylthiotransferase MiaB [Planctomycetota bacterium]